MRVNGLELAEILSFARECHLTVLAGMGIVRPRTQRAVTLHPRVGNRGTACGGLYPGRCCMLLHRYLSNSSSVNAMLHLPGHLVLFKRIKKMGENKSNNNSEIVEFRSWKRVQLSFHLHGSFGTHLTGLIPVFHRLCKPRVRIIYGLPVPSCVVSKCPSVCYAPYKALSTFNIGVFKACVYISTCLDDLTHTYVCASVVRSPLRLSPLRFRFQI